MRVLSKTIKLLLLTLCALIALSLLADRYGSRILEQELVKLFASGTGCDVQITNTNINLLTSEASAENVSISCEGGSDEDLLQIGKISTQIFLPALLTKQIILSHLSLKEVKAVSLSESSGLRALLGFIFGDESKSNEEKWHSGFSSGWRVKVQTQVPLNP
jgi:hypothetical protein